MEGREGRGEEGACGRWRVGRGRGHARRLGCDVGARRKQQLHGFGVALVSCNHQWGAEQANGSEICVGAFRVPDECVTRLKMGQEPSANAHSRGNSIHVGTRRYQHAGNFSEALLHSNAERCEGGTMCRVSIQEGGKGEVRMQPWCNTSASPQQIQNR